MLKYIKLKALVSCHQLEMYGHKRWHDLILIVHEFIIFMKKIEILLENGDTIST